MIYDTIISVLLVSYTCSSGYFDVFIWYIYIYYVSKARVFVLCMVFLSFCGLDMRIAYLVWMNNVFS